MDTTTITTGTRDHSPAPQHEAERKLSLRARWRAIPVPVRSTDATLMTDRSRFIVALISLATLAGGLLSGVLGWTSLSAVLLSLFLVLGVGAAISLTVGAMTAISFTVYAAVAGLTVTTAVGFVLAEAGWWYPRASAVVVAGAATVLLIRALGRNRGGLRQGGSREGAAPPERRSELRHTVIVTVSALAGLAIAAVSAASRFSLPQVGGLLATVPPTWYVGCGLIAFAFGYAAWRRVSPAAPVMAAGTVVILSQALMYGTPTVMAAARHIGLIEYIRTFGEVDASLDIYQGWPGLFAGSAWLTDATGIAGQIGLATWWPVLITPVTILAVRLLAGRFLSPNRAWVAAAVYALADSVNSTYFSPQAYGFLVAMAVIALLIVPPAGESSRRRQIRIAVATVGILGIVVTHQISPFMLTFALTALVAFRLLQPWWAPLLAFLPATAWALVHLKLIMRFIDPSDLGSILANIAPPEHPEAVAGVAPVTRLVFAVPAAALVVLGVIALVVVLRRRDHVHFGLAAAFISPIGLALGTNYGQEGIFRIVLFAIPWLGILVASANPPRHLGRILLAGGAVVMMAVNSYGQSGLDWARVMRADDAAVTAHFERTAAFGSTVLSLGTKNATPARITERYDQVDYTSRIRVGGFADQVGAAYDPAADLAYVTEEYYGRLSAGHYMLVSDSIGAYDDRYGLQRYADYERLRDEVARSPLWTAVYSTPNATLYKLTDEPPYVRR